MKYTRYLAENPERVFTMPTPSDASASAITAAESAEKGVWKSRKIANDAVNLAFRHTGGRTQQAKLIRYNNRASKSAKQRSIAMQRINGGHPRSCNETDWNSIVAAFARD